MDTSPSPCTMPSDSEIEEPDFSHLPEQKFDWPRTIYANVVEELPKDLLNLWVNQK